MTDFPLGPIDAGRLERERATLASIEGHVGRFADRHVAKQAELWMPTDLLPADCVSLDMSPKLIVTAALGLFTEDGLMHYYALLRRYLGNSSVYVKWSGRWAAEEERHGTVLRMLLERTRGIDWQAFDRMKFDFISAGFDPAWGDSPYRILAYTVPQERCTQFSHQNECLLSGGEPTTDRVFSAVGGDEARHYGFYRQTYATILAADPSGAVIALAEVLTNFRMPGANVSHFKKLSYIAAQVGILDSLQFKMVVRELIKFFKLEDLSDLSDRAKAARDAIRELGRPAEERGARISKKIPFRFDFLPDQTVVV